MAPAACSAVRTNWATTVAGRFVVLPAVLFAVCAVIASSNRDLEPGVSLAMIANRRRRKKGIKLLFRVGRFLTIYVQASIMISERCSEKRAAFL